MEDKDYPSTERRNGGGIRFYPYRSAGVTGKAACLKPPNEVGLQAHLWLCHSWGNEGQRLQEEGNFLRILETAGLWHSFNQELKDKVKTEFLQGQRDALHPLELKLLN